MPEKKPRLRRDSGAGSIFERTATTRQGKAFTRYVASFELPSDSLGNRRRKTIYGKNRQDVLEKMQKAKQDYARMGNLPTSDPTLTQWCDLWLAEHGRRLKPSVLPGYRSKIDTWIKPTIGKQKLSRLTADHVRLMHRAMREKKAAPNHVMAVHRVLSAVLADAVKEEKVPRNAAKVAGGPGVARSQRRALRVGDAIKVMIAAAEHDPLAVRWPFAFLTGHRQGERLGLRWSMLDLDAGTADVSWSLAAIPWAHGCTPPCGKRPQWCPKRHLPIEDGYEHVPLEGNLILQRPKSESSQRMTPLVGNLIDPLRQRHAQVLEQRPLYTVDHDLVFCLGDGRPVHPHDDWEMWKRLLDLAKVENFTQHEIRHTTVTLLMELGVDPSVIKEIVGHSDMLTQEGYKHVSLDLSRAALEGLGRVLELPTSAATA